MVPSGTDIMEMAMGNPMTDRFTREEPLLIGERGQYAMAAGQDAAPYLDAMEHMTSDAGLIPEQVRDAEDIPERGLFRGEPTRSAMPLAWAHAEYLKLLRPQNDGTVWECWPLVKARYRAKRGNLRVVGQCSHQRRTWCLQLPGGVRIAVDAPVDIIWTTVERSKSQANDFGTYWADILVDGVETLMWTFYWTSAQRWEGRNWAMTRSIKETKDG